MWSNRRALLSAASKFCRNAFFSHSEPELKREAWSHGVDALRGTFARRDFGILVDLGILSEVEEPKEEEEVIQAIKRQDSGKIICKKIRRQGYVPSMVFEGRDGHKGGHKELISVEAKQISRLLKKYGVSFFLSKTFDLSVAGDEEEGGGRITQRVIPHSLHQHAGNDQLLNVTFMRITPNAHIKVDIPLLYIGHESCPGIRRGGVLNTIKRTVRYICPGDEIPTHIEVDLSKLNVGDKVLLRDLPVSPSLRLFQKDASLPVCKISGSRSSEFDGDADA